MTIRNGLLLITVVFFVVAFLVTPDGCDSYTRENNRWVCDDPSGIGLLVGGVAHMLFAGLAILSAALVDHHALFRRNHSGD